MKICFLYALVKHCTQKELNLFLFANKSVFLVVNLLDVRNYCLIYLQNTYINYNYVCH